MTTNTEQQPPRRVNIRLDEGVHHELRVELAKAGISCQELVESYLLAWLRRQQRKEQP